MTTKPRETDQPPLAVGPTSPPLGAILADQLQDVLDHLGDVLDAGWLPIGCRLDGTAN
jgi:hypothetical protein